MKLSDNVIKFMGGADKYCHCLSAVAGVVYAYEYGVYAGISVSVIIAILEICKEKFWDTKNDKQDILWTYIGIVLATLAQIPVFLMK